MTQQPQKRALNRSCEKCGGLLIVEQALDYYWPLSAWKCFNCGWCRRETQPFHRSGVRVAHRGAYK